MEPVSSQDVTVGQKVFDFVQGVNLPGTRGKIRMGKNEDKF